MQNIKSTPKGNISVFVMSTHIVQSINGILLLPAKIEPEIRLSFVLAIKRTQEKQFRSRSLFSFY